MEEKMTICRSYTRKVNLGNYESEDYFSSRSIEVPIDTTIEDTKKISEDLFVLAMTDVERDKRKMASLREEGSNVISSEKLKQILDDVGNGRPILIGDYLDLSQEQIGKVQDEKRAYKRKEYAKKKEKK